MKVIKIKQNNNNGVKEIAYTVEAMTNFPDAYDKLRTVFVANDTKFDVDDLGAGSLLITHDGLESQVTVLSTLKELSDCIACTEFENYLIINKLQILVDDTSVEDEYTLEETIAQLEENEANVGQAPICVCKVDSVSDDAVDSTLQGRYTRDEVAVAVVSAIPTKHMTDAIYFVYDIEEKRLLFSTAGLEVFE